MLQAQKRVAHHGELLPSAHAKDGSPAGEIVVPDHPVLVGSRVPKPVTPAFPQRVIRIVADQFDSLGGSKSSYQDIVVVVSLTGGRAAVEHGVALNMESVERAAFRICVDPPAINVEEDVVHDPLGPRLVLSVDAVSVSSIGVWPLPPVVVNQTAVDLCIHSRRPELHTIAGIVNNQVDELRVWPEDTYASGPPLGAVPVRVRHFKVPVRRPGALHRERSVNRHPGLRDLADRDGIVFGST